MKQGSAEVNKKIFKLLLETDLSHEAIAEILNVHKHTVYKVSYKQLPRKVREERKRKVISEAKTKKSGYPSRTKDIVADIEMGIMYVKEIAEKYEVSRQRIHQIAEKHNLPLKTLRTHPAIYIRKCSICGKTQSVEGIANANKKFCSPECKQKSLRPDNFCGRCGKVFPFEQLKKAGKRPRKSAPSGWVQAYICSGCIKAHTTKYGFYRRPHDPAWVAKQKEATDRYYNKLKADPEKWAEYKEKQRKKYFELKADPVKYRAYLDRSNARKRKREQEEKDKRSVDNST